MNLNEWSRAVRERDGNRCIMCGKPHARLNAHHLIEKTRLTAGQKTDVQLGVALCPACHRFSRFSAHSNPLYFAEMLRHRRPDQWAHAMAISQQWEKEKSQ